MKITRYVVEQISLPFLVGTTILSAIAGGYVAATSLTDAWSVQPTIVVYLISLRLITVLDVILPSALYFSVVVGLGRLHLDSEIVALRAAGLSEWQLLRGVLYLALVVALLAGLAANVGRPWAFRVTYALQARAASELAIEAIPVGRFFEMGNQVVFAGAADNASERLLDVYVYTDMGSRSNRIVTAQSLVVPRSTTDRPTMFENGSLYLLDRHGANDRVLHFDTLTLSRAVVPVGYRRKAADTRQLVRSDNPQDIAELQWRIAAPVTTITLALLAVPLSRRSPREGAQRRNILVVFVYAVLFSLFGVAHSVVDQGRVPAFPGIWWFYLVPFAGTWLLLARSGWAGMNRSRLVERNANS